MDQVADLSIFLVRQGRLAVLTHGVAVIVQRVDSHHCVQVMDLHEGLSDFKFNVEDHFINLLQCIETQDPFGK